MCGIDALMQQEQSFAIFLLGLLMRSTLGIAWILSKIFKPFHHNVCDFLIPKYDLHLHTPSIPVLAVKNWKIAQKIAGSCHSQSPLLVDEHSNVMISHRSGKNVGSDTNLSGRT